MGTLLVGYDVESAAVGETLARFPLEGTPYPLALDVETTERALDILIEAHEFVGVPATLFVCGRTFAHSVPAMLNAAQSPLIDIQQHTYSHVYFKDFRYQASPTDAPIVIPASSESALRVELRISSTLISEYLNRPCIGLRTPLCFHEGLRGHPELLAILRDEGIRYVSSWGRNESGGNPTPWIQPFAYGQEGFDDILEIPAQHWLDVVWFDQHGYDRGADYLEVLKQAIDQIAESDLVYGACFHDWTLLASDATRTGWLRGFLEYAVESGVQVFTYTDYWQRSQWG